MSAISRPLLFAALVALPVLARPARAQEIWTQAASTCAIDSEDLDEFNPDSASLRFNRLSRGTLLARCNVTNPRSDGGDPGWGTLEVVYRDRDGADTKNRVRAKLVFVNNRGNATSVAEFDSDNFPDAPDPTLRSSVFTHSFDFHGGAYYIELKVSRSSLRSENDPAVYLVRLTS